MVMYRLMVLNHIVQNKNIYILLQFYLENRRKIIKCTNIVSGNTYMDIGICWLY